MNHKKYFLGVLGLACRDPPLTLPTPAYPPLPLPGGESEGNRRGIGCRGFPAVRPPSGSFIYVKTAVIRRASGKIFNFKLDNTLLAVTALNKLGFLAFSMGTIAQYPSPVTALGVFTYVSPCLRVSVSPCLRVSMSPCLHVSVTPCLRVSVSPCLPSRSPLKIDGDRIRISVEDTNGREHFGQ